MILGELLIIYYFLKQLFANIQTKHVAILVSLLELFIICALIIIIKTKYQSTILGTATSIIAIESSDYVFSKDKFKFFYEPKSNSERTDSVDWLPEKITYKLNDEGFNSPVNFSIKKPDKTFRIITIGDSFTFGLYVNPTNNYPSQLQNSLNNNLKCSLIDNFEIINLGVPGYDLEYTIERYTRRGQKYSPDLVIWFIKQDDILHINDLIKERADSYLKIMTENGDLKKYQEQGYFYPNITFAQQDLVNEMGVQNILDRQKRNLEYFSSLYNGRLLIFTSPDKLETYLPTLKEYTKNRRLTHLMDSYPGLNAKTEILKDGHPNKLGYKFIAQLLFNYIQSNNIIPCNI